MTTGLSVEQIELRRTGIGASEVAALAGLSRWATPIQIYEQKVLGLAKTATLRMRLGNLLEEPVCKLYAEETGRRYLSHPGTVRSPDHSFVLATPDRAVHTVFQRPKKTVDWESVERLLQVKTTDWRALEYWRDPQEDPTGVPEEVLAQTTWEMGATGVRLCDVAVLFDRQEFRIYTIPFDRAFFALLLETAQRFYVDHVLARRPPPPDASEQYSSFLKRMHPGEQPGAIRPATPEIERVADRLRRTEGLLKRLEAKKLEAQNQVKAFIGDLQGLVTSHGTTTWKKTRDGAKTDWEQVARDLLDLVCPKDSPDEAQWLDAYRRLLAEHTRPIAGHRQLIKPWSREKK